VEPRENEDAVNDRNVDIEVDPEEVTVKFEGKKTFQDVKDQEKCFIGEEKQIREKDSLLSTFLMSRQDIL